MGNGTKFTNHEQKNLQYACKAITYTQIDYTNRNREKKKMGYSLYCYYTPEERAHYFCHIIIRSEHSDAMIPHSLWQQRLLNSI